MGRAFRVLKRTAHLTVQVAERPEKIVAVGDRASAEARARSARGGREDSDGRRSRRTKAKE